MTKKRFNNLSIYRLIATICVLQFHVFYIMANRAVPYEELLSKGVQGLTALSGFLYSQKLITDYKKFYLGNLKKIMIPATICFLVMALWNLVSMFFTKDFNYIGQFFGHRVYNNGLLIQPGNYYYIAYIFLCYLVTPILQRNDKWSVLVVVSTVVLELSLRFFLGPAIIATSYIVGYYLGRKVFKQVTDPEEKFDVPQFLLYALIVVVSVGGYILCVEFMPATSYFLTHLKSLTVNIFATSLGIFSLFFIIHLFRWTNRFGTIRVLQYLDRMTLIVYLMNQAFMIGGMNITGLVEPFWAKILLVNVFTIAISVLIELVNRFTLKKLEFKRAE